MIDLTAKLVAAYLRGNAVDASELPALIKSTHAAFVGVTQPPEAPATPQAPFISVKKSVTPDAIICLECGKPQQMIKRHLHTAHGLSTDGYKTKWSLPSDYPMVAPNYAQKRSQLAIASGLGQKHATSKIEESVPESPQQPTNRYPASRWSRPKS